jgi:hypothetical protein
MKEKIEGFSTGRQRARNYLLFQLRHITALSRGKAVAPYRSRYITLESYGISKAQTERCAERICSEACEALEA